MPAVFYYSRKYGDQGPPVTAPTADDKFSISVPFSGGTYGTRLTNLRFMVNFTSNYLKLNGFNFATSNGLKGAGTTAQPLEVDRNWMETNFINTKYWPFSQVGDPSDITLPIAGSYFSVTYPYGDYAFYPTVFVEGNGDLRVLRTVTNGEDVRLTYATWKNYRRTHIDTMTLTDNVYEPPGLLVGEHIHCTHQMSSRAALMEIWTNSGFKEYVFITLNGTAISQYHNMLRLGTTPLTVFDSFTTDLYGRRTFLNRSNIIATILNGQKYLITTAQPKGKGECAFQVAQVNDNGTCTLLGGFTATNTHGFTTSGGNLITMHSKLATYDPNDKDRLWYLSDPGLYAIQSYATPRISGQELPDGTLGITVHHYDVVGYESASQNALKAQLFYILDIPNRRMYPEPVNGVNRKYQVNHIATGSQYAIDSAMVFDRYGHYWAQHSNFVMLPTGDRMQVITTGSSTDITPTILLFPGSGNDIWGAMRDSTFSGESASMGRNLVLTSPTPVQAAKSAYIMHDYMITTNEPDIGPMYINGAASRLDGSYTDRTYNLLNSGGVVAQAMSGYNLTSNRRSLNSFSLGMNQFKDQFGNVYYHNAAWGRNGNINDVHVANIDANLNPVGRYTCSPDVYTTLENYLMNYFRANIPEGFTEIHNMGWMIMPAHMYVGRNHVFYKIAVSFRIPDPSDARGYRFSGSFFWMGRLPATIAVNGDGDCRLSAIDVSRINFSKWLTMTGNYGIGSGAPQQQSYNCAFTYSGDMVRAIIGGGFGSSTHTGGNWNGWCPHGLSCNSDNSVNEIIMFRTEIRSKVGYHKNLGLCWIHNTYGLGAVYVFQPIDELTLQSKTIGPYVLGSARPAAGFNLTVNGTFELYVQGEKYQVPIQTVDLTTIQPAGVNNHKSTKFYMYVVIKSGVAKLVVSYYQLPEHMTQIFIGAIYTSTTEITSIEAEPISRWELARPKVIPAGTSLPVSTGVPSDDGAQVGGIAKNTIWDKFTLDTTSQPTEYLWGPNDIYDTDFNHEMTVTDNWWSATPDGTARITVGDYGTSLWFFARFTGPLNYVEMNMVQVGMQDGVFEKYPPQSFFNWQLTDIGGGVKQGVYEISTLDEDEMSFKNSSYVDVTATRAINRQYVNDTGKTIFIAISVHTSDDHNSAQLFINGLEVAYTDGYQSSGTGHWYPNLGFIVPPGHTYQFNASRQYVIQRWVELRPN